MISLENAYLKGSLKRITKKEKVNLIIMLLLSLLNTQVEEFR